MAEDSVGMASAAAPAQATSTVRRPGPPLVSSPRAAFGKRTSLLGNLRERHLLVPVAVGLAALVFVILLVGGYAWGWKWTGFKQNSLWDWFSLLTTPFAISAAGFVISIQQSRNSRQMNIQQHQEGILDTYLTDLTHLMLDSHLRESPPDSPLRAVARASTRATARRVSQHQRQVMLHFLNDFGLIAGATPVLSPDEAADIFADVDWSFAQSVAPPASA